MRRWSALILAWVSLCIGLLTVLPRLHPRTWKLQLGLTEFSWIGILAGFVSLNGDKSVSVRRTALLGSVLAAVPILRFPRTVALMNNEVGSVLGSDIELRLPGSVRDRLSPSRIWWLNSLKLAAKDHFYENEKVQVDLPFLKTPQQFLKLDVYRPVCKPLDGEHYPAIIVIHGGSWFNGDKGGYFSAHNRYLARQGYVVFDIQYRQTREADVKWPIPLEDVCHAIEWVRSKDHAKMFNIDVNRIALYGRSAGGHLALCAAYTMPPSTINSVVAVYSPTDLKIFGAVESEAVTRLMGGDVKDLPHTYEDASPVWNISENSPATLLLHGNNDALVSPLHSEILYNRLKAEGVPAILLKVPWSRHGFDALMSGYGAQLTQYYVDRFLANYLYGAKST